MMYLGIDPGVSGGLALIAADGRVEWAVGMPETDRDILDRIVGAAVLSTHVRAAIEKVAASPQMGVTSSFTFGFGYGRLIMALAASDIPFDYVHPSKWQASLGCRSGGDKNVTKRRAQELFPSLKITHKTADALLIAEYMRRLDQGLLAAPNPRASSAAAATRGKTTLF
jgi:crossover junction endodeoxyribonuclease RuvC